MIIRISSIVILLSAWATSANATVYPKPDINGYTSQYDEPFIAESDSCANGRTCHVLPTPTGSVTCAGGSGGNPNAGDEYIIRDNNGWNQINSGRYNKFFVCPGDYTGRGTIVLSEDGTAGRPRWIVWWNDSGYDAYTHPYNMAAKNLAIVDRITFQGGDFTYLDRLRIHPKSFGSTGNAIYVQNGYGAAKHIYNRLWIDAENARQSSPSSSDGGIHISWSNDGPIIIQNSLIHNCALGVNVDSTGIYFDRTNPVITVNNEIFNCGHMWFPSGNASEHDHQGTIAENNDFYVTNALYADCGTGNSLNRNGRCMCSEGGAAMKHGSRNPSNPMRFIRNRLWGFRPQAINTNGWKACGGSGAPAGAALDILYWAHNIVIEQNIFSDSQMGIIAGNDDDRNGTWNLGNITIQNNLFHDTTVTHKYQDSNYASPIWWGTPWKSLIQFNSFVNVSNSELWFHSAGNDIHFDCNLIVNAGRKNKGWNTHANHNVYVSVAEDLGDTSKWNGGIGDANLRSYTYYRKLITGPEKVTVNNAVPREASVLRGRCGGYTSPNGYGS